MDINISHATNANQNSESAKNLRNTLSKHEQVRYECDLCRKIFQSVGNINKHRKKKNMKRTKQRRLEDRRLNISVTTVNMRQSDPCVFPHIYSGNTYIQPSIFETSVFSAFHMFLLTMFVEVRYTLKNFST